ncbi:MAG: mandelate racemase/muconate lactonizing enzyme family protein [Dehalococcoidia bacterium]|nr:mandelate racemase/muconate lactonizing enzyme family protein [Dehalococcoidia bacterium]
MKITAVKPYPITEKDGDESFLFVKVETDEGIYGVGEAAFLAMGRTVVEAINHTAKVVIGEDPFATEQLWQRMFRAGAAPADKVVCSAISAIDIALWDIKGKALGVPVYRLLGGPTRDKIDFFKHIMNDDGNIDGLVANAVQAVDEGFKYVRWWLFETEPGIFEPVDSLRHMVKQVEAIREAVDDDIGLILDFHTRVDPDMAIWLSKELEQHRPLVIEDPIRAENPASYRNFGHHVSLPIAAGEHWASKWQFREAIEGDLIQIARPDVTLVGGITEAKKIAAMCEAHYMDVVPHGPTGPVSTAACNHLSFSNPKMVWGDASPGTGTYVWDVFPVQPTFDNGSMARDETPGLGVEFNEDAIKEYSFEPYHLPRFNRRDGSLNNW